MSKYTHRLSSIIAILGFVFANQAIAATSFQEAWEEEQADVRANEVIESNTHIVKSSEWYLENVKDPYQDNPANVSVTGQFDTKPWYLMG